MKAGLKTRLLHMQLLFDQSLSLLYATARLAHIHCLLMENHVNLHPIIDSIRCCHL